MRCKVSIKSSIMHTGFKLPFASRQACIAFLGAGVYEYGQRALTPPAARNKMRTFVLHCARLALYLRRICVIIYR
jgi:hypothetical protein